MVKLTVNLMLLVLQWWEYPSRSPRFGLAIVILAFAQLDIDMLRDFKIAVGGGGHIVIKRAVAQVGTICAENQGTGTECGKNQRTDKA